MDFLCSGRLFGIRIFSMPSADSVYIGCDELDNLPAINRENWLWELEWLAKHLPNNATVLQVGCMDGTRILRLLEKRPDLKITGLDIDEPLLDRAREHFKTAGKSVPLIHANITTAEIQDTFDFVLCLNNTLGYIAENERALEQMKRYGKTTIVSVYGEAFDDDAAKEYFDTIGLQFDTVDGNTFRMKDFVQVRRFTKGDVRSWDGKITETPLGYLCDISA